MATPQTILYKGCKIVQASNNHIQIFDLKTGRRVFHAACIKRFDEKELMEAADFYLELKASGKTNTDKKGDTDGSM